MLLCDVYACVESFKHDGYLAFEWFSCGSPLFYVPPPAKKHRSVSVELPAAEATWGARTELVSEQLEGG